MLQKILRRSVSSVIYKIYSCRRPTYIEENCVACVYSSDVNCKIRNVVDRINWKYGDCKNWKCENIGETARSLTEFIKGHQREYRDQRQPPRYSTNMQKNNIVVCAGPDQHRNPVFTPGRRIAMTDRGVRLDTRSTTGVEYSIFVSIQYLQVFLVYYLISCWCYQLEALENPWRHTIIHTYNQTQKFTHIHVHTH